MSRTVAVAALAIVVAAGCVVQRRSDPAVGRGTVLGACGTFRDAIAAVSAAQITPSEAADRIAGAAQQAGGAAAVNTRWDKLAGDMKFAVDAIRSLDPERVKQDRLYVPNGPAAQVIDAVVEECRAVESSSPPPGD